MFEIDLKSRKSIYQQVIDNIKTAIIKGELKPDDKLPSVRELSKSLFINPNTVAKAYKELERESYIYTTNGRGSFVSDIGTRKIDNDKLEQIKKQLSQNIDELRYLGLNEGEIFKQITELIRRNK